MLRAILATILLLAVAPAEGRVQQEDQLAALEAQIPALRRSFRHTELLARLERIAEQDKEQQADGRLAAWITLISGERRLLRLVAADEELRRKKVVDVVRLLAEQELDGASELQLARFCALHSLEAEVEEALARARELDPATKDESDRLLAQVRGEELPRGGYFRYRGRFVPLEQRDREQALDEALERVALAGPPDILESFRPSQEAANLAEFERRFGGRGGDLLRDAAESLRAALLEEYAAVRGWLPSYAKQPSLRHNLLDRLDLMAAPRREMRNLIARYDKPQQPEVDDFRRTLEGLYKRYEELLSIDSRALNGIGVDRAQLRLESIRCREEALAAVDRYLSEYDSSGLPAAEVAPPPEADSTGRHLLPGRRQSGLEDSLWIMLHFAAGHDVETMSRCDELLTQRNSLTRWERMLVDQLRADAVERYNDSCASSLDLDERFFMQFLNRYRRVLGLSPFEIEERCNVASRKHSREMVDLGYFGHISPVARNRTPTDRVRLEGYGGGVGENCLAGRCDGRAAFEAWYHSPGHHRNLVSGGPHLGVGATRDHAMWTMVAGGADLAWRVLHRSAGPAEQRRLAELAASVAESLAAGAITEEVRRALFAAVPQVLPAFARLAFAASNDGASPHRESWPTLISLIIDADAPTEWRPLQIAAVAALIDGMEWDSKLKVRALAWTLVNPLLGETFAYDPKAPPGPRRLAVIEIRKFWEEVGQFRYRQGSAAEARERSRPAGRKGDGPSLEAPLKLLSARERLTLARQYGGGNDTEKAVERGLRWLARVQDSDGAWRARSFATVDQRFRGHEKSLGQGNAEWEVGMTGLALLAFVSAGNTTEQGDHHETVARGAQFLLERIIDYGKFETTSSHYMYNHAIATQALCELYAYTADRRIGIGAQLCLDYLAYAQHQLSGGWRYVANEAGDMSVTGWVVMALNSGYKARLDVSGFRGALRFLGSVTWPGYFRIGYTHRKDGGTVRLGAVGMLCRLFLEAKKEDSQVLLNAWRIKRALPGQTSIDFYYWYYATLGLFQLGGDFWKEWNEALVPELLRLQNTEGRSPFNGSWPPQGEWSNVGGRIYQTALGVLMLTTYYRYDRLRSPRVVPFTGDAGKQLKPYIDQIRNAEDEVVQSVAARRMADLFGTAAASELFRLLRDEQEGKEFRRRLAFLLVDCVGGNHEAALLALLEKEQDELVAEAIVRALEGVGSEISVKLLVGYLDHEVRELRAHAARTLGMIGDAGAAAAIAKRLDLEQDDWCKSLMNAALTRLSHRKEIDLFVKDALKAGSADRLRVLSGLDLLESGGVARFLNQTKEKEPRLYQRALQSVAEHRQAAAVPLLMILLESEDRDTRAESLKLLKILTGQDLQFDADKPLEDRQAALVRWQAWWSQRLEEYRLRDSR